MVIDVFLFSMFVACICVLLEEQQEEVEQGEGGVDQGQEQGHFSEGKPFIHAYP